MQSKKCVGLPFGVQKFVNPMAETLTYVKIAKQSIKRAFQSVQQHIASMENLDMKGIEEPLNCLDLPWNNCGCNLGRGAKSA